MFRKPGEHAPDATGWVALAGGAAFVLLFLAALTLLVFRQSGDSVALPTPLDPEAPSATPATLAQVAGTAAAPEAPTAEAPTAVPTPVLQAYQVQEGENLTLIAEKFGVSVQQILDANDISDPNSIVVGQQLLIPIVPTPAPQATATGASAPNATAATLGGLPRSIFEGGLAAFYPLTLSGPRVTIHYQPGSFTDRTGPDIIEGNAEAALALVEQRLGVEYTDSLDIYLAGTLFAEPDVEKRGRAFPTQYRAFVLYDGSGSADERRYMLAQEVTHVVAWHTYGVPSTIMLAEGLAAYTGQSYLEQGGFIPYVDFCRALEQAGRLSSIASLENNTQAFQGHIRFLYNNYVAACFVNFLFGRAGPEAFEALYPTSNYTGNYGAALGQLDVEFQQSLNEDASPLAFDPNELVGTYDEVAAGYDRLLRNPNPDLEAYGVLDKARLAAMAGDFDAARAGLDEFKTMLP